MASADASGSDAGGDSPILVIGGAGFIGSHVVEALLARGNCVRVLDDLSSGRPQNLPMEDCRLDLMVGDILDFHTVREAMSGVRRCIHLAAQVSPERSLEDPYGSALWNILGFINVLEAAHERRLDRFVYASSAAVYGNGGDGPLDEQAPTRPVSPYGLEKVVNEQYADLYHRVHGLSTLGLRYFHVYGARQNARSPYSGEISEFADRMVAGGAPLIHGDPLQTRDFIHVEDAAEATIAALDADYCGLCNVASGKRVDLLQVAELLGERMGVDAEPDLEPARPGEVNHGVADVRTLRRQLHFATRRTLRAGLADFAPAVPRGAERQPPHAVEIEKPAVPVATAAEVRC
jgi:UDP-glucose 4-epimerase